MSVFFRSKEGWADDLAVSGAGYGTDPVDPTDVAYRQAGSNRRDVPAWTLEKARTYSVHAYRTNPMARAVIDTYTTFCVGESGLKLQCANPDVRAVTEDFWQDPANALSDFRRQELLLRGHMLMGETALEMMVGPATGVTRFSYIDPAMIEGVELDRGNPLWPSKIRARSGIAEIRELDVVRVDELTRLRTGQVLFEPSWRALPSDRRGFPFLAPIVDWLKGYDDVLWNLIDRTALARYLVWDVTVDGDQSAVDGFIAKRGNLQVPRSGSMEVHNDKVHWEAKTADVKSREDRETAQQLLTNVAAGAGLAKTWLAEPENANRATSLTMAEPVRRRVSGVQNLWLAINTELVRFSVDRAVAARRVSAEVGVQNEAGDQQKVPAAQTVTVTGPEIAAADAKVAAEILAHLSTAIAGLVTAGMMSEEAGKVAARKAWEDFVGIPYKPELDKPGGAATDDIAGLIDQTEAEGGREGAIDRLVA